MSLTRRQKKALRALDDFGLGDLDDVCNHMKVKPAIFSRWMQDENFRNELECRLDNLRHLSNILLVCGLPKSIARLNELLNTGSPETDRKTCADIHKRLNEHTKAKHAEKPEKPAPPQIITDAAECERLWNLYAPNDLNVAGEEKERLEAIDKMYNTANT